MYRAEERGKEVLLAEEVPGRGGHFVVEGHRMA